MKDKSVIEIGIKDVYDVLIKQVLPVQGEINAHLDALNGGVVRCQEATGRNAEVLDQHELGISKLWTEVSVVKAVTEVREKQQQDDMLQIQEVQKESHARVREMAGRVWEITVKLGEIGMVVAVILKVLDLW